MRKILYSVFILFLLPFHFTIAGDMIEKALADKIIEKTYPDGQRSIVANGLELKDLTPQPEPVPTDIDEFDIKLGYTVYSRSQSDQIFRFSAPKKEERINGLKIALCPDEKRHSQFAIYALKDIGDVNVSIGVLKGRKGVSLPVEAVKIGPVRLGLWRDYWDPWFKESPKLIDVQGAKTTVSKGQNQQYWITVNIPSSTQPDIYIGEINVKAQGGGLKKIKFVVEVLPFKLADGMWWGVYYYSGFNENTPRDFADMKAHGVNSMLICPPGHVDPVLERDGNSVKVSFPQTDLAMAELKKQGFDRPVAYYPRFLSSRILQMFDRVDGEKFKAYDYYGQGAVDFKPEDYPEDMKLVLKDVFRQMVSHAKEAGWPEILWYFDDEPGANDAPGHMIPLKWAQLEYHLFKEMFPQEKTLCTIYKLDVYKKVPVDFCVGDLWRLNDEFVSYVLSKDAQVWAIRFLCQYNIYNFPRQFAGMGIEKRDITGFTEWTYYGAPLYKPYDQLLNKEGCHYAYVNDKEQLLTTIPWEAVQEGIYDSRYIVTLRKMVEKAKSLNEDRYKALADKGEKTLQQVMEKIPDSRITSATLTELEMDDMRKVLADTIKQFVSAGVCL